MFLDRYRDQDKSIQSSEYKYKHPQLGINFENNKTVFRLFLRNAEKVFLNIFDNPGNTAVKKYELKNAGNDIWEFETSENFDGKFYGYTFIRDGKITRKIHLDPYAKAVASFNTYLSPRLGIIYHNDFNWDGDTWIKRDWRDLVIYELHLRDITKHPSSGAKHPGTYSGIIEENVTGGIDYIETLGVNAVEFLPLQEFASVEIPYKTKLKGRYNTWNQHERNHWGYMTSAYFAPSSFYAEDWNEFQWETWMGTSGNAVTQMKKMVKAFHQKGISVIMDVVYNHFSEYEFANLKELDEDYYFRKDEKGKFISESYCGNDLKSENPFVRKLIIDSIIYWMTEYHIDGFRFDLGKILDWETIEEVIAEARKINPDVIFICEPWGGGYDPKRFSERGWSSWNDQIRNGIKGENPFHGKGWIFNEWYGNNNYERVKSYLRGTLTKDQHGLFQKAEHSVNYLESHDGYTLGDFIRIGTGIDHHKKIDNLDLHVKLNPEQLKLNKLAAMFLLVSKGMIMIHAGQEFAHSKVIAENKFISDERAGLMDHNSYEKDDETNYINYEHSEINSELLEYYKGLIQIRNKFDAFRYAENEDYVFYEIGNSKFAFAVKIKYQRQELLALFNSENIDIEFNLPDGVWQILANEKSAGLDIKGCVQKQISLPSKSGKILVKEN